MKQLPATPPGGALENFGLMLHLLLDLATGPCHLVLYLFTRGRQRADFRRALISTEAVR
ncbi:MAG: hypothetical protein ACT4PU_05595 [Planctomycetota bacterium]